jgi:predicted ATP-grasp superfamily ATP-dependent carboligase
MQTLLVVGFATRHVALSAARAGYRVYAIDHFCDQDLKACTTACFRFEELEEIPGLVRKLCDENQIDAILSTSGAEDLENPQVPILGTPRTVASKFLDKALMQDFFIKNGFPVPPLAGKDEFPAMLKPCVGSGGWRNQLVTGNHDIEAWRTLFPDLPFILQQYMPGIPASVCCVTDGRRAKALAVNLQILRGTDEARFGFCGSQTPFLHPMNRRMREMAEEIAAASGCVGIIGIDFIVSDEHIYPIEINPRFVATLDTIEQSTGLNLVSLHVNACNGLLPDRIPDSTAVCVRKILFAPHNLVITGDLGCLAPLVADIPEIGTSFLAGEAVVSLFGSGPDEDAAYRSLDKTIRIVSQYMR